MMKYWIVVMLLCVGVCVPLPAQAMRLDAPARVARGDAFVATAWCAAATGTASFAWRNHAYNVDVNAAGAAAREALPGVEGVAYMLLPVPVDYKDGNSMTLTVRCPGEETQQRVALYTKDRPVQRLEVEKKYVNPPKSVQERIAADRRKTRAAVSVFSPVPYWQLPLNRPVPGDVSSLYGLKRVFNGEPRSVHKGLDLRGAQGQPIQALADGTVVLVDDLYFSGNVVYIDHGLGVVSASLHMSRQLVQPGQFVHRGDVIGLVGSTGRVTGPHLHLSLMVQGVPVDPLPLLGVHTMHNAD